MSIDYSSIASNSAILASIMVPLLTYINKKSQTYFLDLMGIPFAIFLITAVTSAIAPNGYTIFLFVCGVVLEIIIYALITSEQYYFEKYRVTHHTS